MSTDTSAAAELDEKLVERAAQGDEAAFKQLFDRHARLVYTVAYRILGDREDAEDVMQEVFLVLHRDLGRFRAQARFATWLFQIVTARAFNHRKQRGAYQARLSRLAEEAPRAETRSPDDRIQEALQTLPEEYRTLAVLRYFVGLSYEELAKIGNWPLGTVKSKMFRIHQALRSLLEEDGAKP